MNQNHEEEGFTRYPHWYVDAKARIRIPGRAGQLLTVIERLTFGWHRDGALISRKTFREKTGIRYSRTIDFELNVLRAMKMVVSRKTKKGTVYRIQKDTSLWKSPASNIRPVTEEEAPASNIRPDADESMPASNIRPGVAWNIRPAACLNNQAALKIKKKIIKEKEKEKKKKKKKIKERGNRQPPSSPKKEKSKNRRAEVKGIVSGLVHGKKNRRASRFLVDRAGQKEWESFFGPGDQEAENKIHSRATKPKEAEDKKPQDKRRKKKDKRIQERQSL